MSTNATNSTCCYEVVLTNWKLDGIGIGPKSMALEKYYVLITKITGKFPNINVVVKIQENIINLQGIEKDIMENIFSALIQDLGN